MKTAFVLLNLVGLAIRSNACTNLFNRRFLRGCDSDGDDDVIEEIIVWGKRPSAPSSGLFSSWSFTGVQGLGGGNDQGEGQDEGEEGQDEEEKDACDDIESENDFDQVGISEDIPLSGGALGIREAASAAADANYPNSPGCANNACDAFRHSYGMYLLTNRFGAWYAKFVGDNHERWNLKNGGSRGATAMDLHNNRIGREIAGNGEYMTNEEAQEAIKDAIDNGDMMTAEAEGCDP